MPDGPQSPPPPPSAQPHDLSYAGPVSTPAPLSRLSLASIILAALSCPCVLTPLLVRIGYLADGPWWIVQLVLLIAATALAIAAVVRVRRSAGARRGFALAVVALGLSVLWWCLLAVAFWMMKSMTFPAPG